MANIKRPWLRYLKHDPLPWLLDEAPVWARPRIYTDLLDRPPDDQEFLEVRSAALANPQVQNLIQKAAHWPGDPITRHNDAKHIIHTLGFLADIGLTKDDPGMDQVVSALLAHRSPEGVFNSLVLVPKAFGGSGEETLSWMLCDSPTVLQALARYGLADHPYVHQAADYLVSIIRQNGWPCAASPEFGKFRGPGRKDDPCPYANLIAVRALAHIPSYAKQDILGNGVEMMLDHWENQKERKIYMFGIGTTFRALKYPLIWYDILHVVDTLSLLPFTHDDPRFKQMLQVIIDSGDEGGRFKAGSVWRAYKDWEFGQKRTPSTWLTIIVLTILKRINK